MLSPNAKMKPNDIGHKIFAQVAKHGESQAQRSTTYIDADNHPLQRPHLATLSSVKGLASRFLLDSPPPTAFGSRN